MGIEQHLQKIFPTVWHTPRLQQGLPEGPALSISHTISFCLTGVRAGRSERRDWMGPFLLIQHASLNCSHSSRSRLHVALYKLFFRFFSADYSLPVADPLLIYFLVGYYKIDHHDRLSKSRENGKVGETEGSGIKCELRIYVK